MEKPPRQPNSYIGSLKPQRDRRPSGRIKGQPNHQHTEAKWCLNEVFRLCGGIDGMLRWAKECPSEFYPLFIRAMVPKPLEIASDGQQITLVIQRLSDPPVPPAPIQLTQAPAQAEADSTG